MANFINSKSYLEMFGKKDEPKSSEKPGPSMFSGLAMKKTSKNDASSASGYVPPAAESSQTKLPETYTYKPPDLDQKRQIFSKSMNDSGSIDSTDNTRSNEDPFADIKIAEENKTQKKNFVPGFGEDEEDDNFEIVKKNKLNIIPGPEVPYPKKTQVKIDDHTQIKIEDIQIKKDEALRNNYRKPFDTKAEEEKKIEKTREENKFLKAIEEKKRREAEEKEKKELEEKIRIEILKQKELEEKQRKEREEKIKAEEEKKKLEIYGDPYALKDLVEETLRKFSSSISQKTSLQEVLKNKQKDHLSSVLSMQSQIKELEELEYEAASREDFEEAAKHNEDLEQIKELCKVHHELIQANSAEYSNIESEKNSLIEQKKKWIIETYENSQGILIKFKKSLEDSKENAENLRKNKSEEIIEESAKIKIKEEELREIKSSVIEKKDELDQKIYEKTEIFQEKEKSLSEELATLKAEIESLEKLLAEKKNNAITLSNNLSSVQEALAVCMEEFEQELSEAEEAEKVVNKDLEETLNIKERLNSEEIKSIKEYNEFIQNYNNRTEDLKVFERELDFLNSEIEKIDSLQKNRLENLQKIQEIEKELKEKEEMLWDAQEYYTSSKENVDDFKESIRKQEEKIKDIQKRIPLLENDKKAAAASKQFKVL